MAIPASQFIPSSSLIGNYKFVFQIFGSISVL